VIAAMIKFFGLTTPCSMSFRLPEAYWPIDPEDA